MPYKVWIHAGVCFFRKSPKLKKLCDNCMDIVENYQTLKDLRNAGSYDEVSLGIAMPMNDMQPKEELDTMLAFMPCCKWVEADIIAGKLSYEKVNGVRVKDDGIFLHFTTRMTHTPLYEHEVLRLAAQLKGKKATIVDKVKAGQVYRNWLQIKYKAKNLFASCLNLPQRIYSRLNRFTN